MTSLKSAIENIIGAVLVSAILIGGLAAYTLANPESQSRYRHDRHLHTGSSS